jgi:MtN3 and saliva related transmembrane protein
MSPELVGWVAVTILFATMAGQAWTEWRDRVKKGINPFFFVGQVAASVAFIAYSAMVGNTIFVVGNTLVLAAALAGGAILFWNKKRR